MTPENFTAVARYATVGMMLLAGDGRILAINDACSEEFDVPAAALVGHSLQEMVTASEAEVCSFLKGASRSRDLYPGRFCLSNDSEAVGDFIFEGALATPGASAQQRRLLVRVQKKRELRKSFTALNQKIDELMSEIVRRKILEEEKNRLLEGERQARLEAEQANRSKDEFLAAISHELRTPMNVIKGWSDLLHQGLLEESEYPEVFETLSRNAEIEVQLINDLLDVSRIVTGQLHLNLQPVQLPSLVQTAIDTLQLTAETRQIKFSAMLDSLTGSVAADPGRLQQVISNVLMNAIKFSDPGGTVQVSLSRRGAHAELSIKDQGIGIEPSFLPYVFEKFRQEDGSHTRIYSGLGLGLTIARHLTELLGGSISAASAGKGQGAIFTIRLPVLGSPPIHAQQPAEKAQVQQNALIGPILTRQT